MMISTPTYNGLRKTQIISTYVSQIPFETYGKSEIERIAHLWYLCQPPAPGQKRIRRMWCDLTLLTAKWQTTTSKQSVRCLRQRAAYLFAVWQVLNPITIRVNFLRLRLLLVLMLLLQKLIMLVWYLAYSIAFPLSGAKTAKSTQIVTLKHS